MAHVLTEGTFQREDEEASRDFTRPENCLEDEAVRHIFVSNVTVLGRGHPELIEISWSPRSSRARPGSTSFHPQRSQSHMSLQRQDSWPRQQANVIQYA